MRLRRLAIPITIVGVVLMLAGAGTVPAAARVQEPGVTAPSAAAMNLPAVVATDTPETSAASGPAPESVVRVRVRVNPSPASTSAKTSAPDWKTDPPDSPTAVSGEEASPAGAAAARGTVNALEPPEGPAVQESAAHTFRDIAVDDGGEGSAAGKQEEPGAGGQPVFQAAAVNSYDITLKPGSNLISLPLIPDYNADVGQDQRDIGSAEESPASVRLVAEVPAPVESAASLTLVDLNNNLLKLEANRSLRESDHAITDTDPSFSHIVTGGDTSNFKPDGTQGTPQLASKGSITCDPGSSPKATEKFEAAISVTNHTLSEDDELYVIVTFSREIYEWNRDRRSTKFSLKQGQTHEETSDFRSLLPGEGYAIECELRRDLTGPLFIGWPDESVATDRKTFSVGDFQSDDTTGSTYSVAEMTECSASASNLQVGATVRLQVRAETKDADSTLIAASFIQIFQDAKLVDSYPSVGSLIPYKKNERRAKEIVVADLTTTGIDRTRLVDYTFTPSEPGLYTTYCFLHTGAVMGFTAKTRNADPTLNDYYKVLSLFLPGGGPAIDFWSGILSGYFSHLESVKSVHFCVGDPEDCEFYSTSDDESSGSDDESSGEPDLEVESLTVSKSAMEPGETFTLTASVLNSGSGESSETTLRYYRSTISTFSTSVMEDPVIYVIGLDPSDTERVSHPLAAPSDPGLYYYRTCVAPASGESDTDNNCSTGVLVTVEATQQGSPDLVVEAPSVSKNEIQPGGRFTLFATVRNIGDARAGSAILQYYRSTDSSISAGSDTKVGSDTVDSLQPSRTDGESVGVSAPEAPGEYYYGACVVRVTGGESDTGNNCSSGRRVTVAQATTKPDLVVDSPSVSQNEVDAGGRFTLRTTVRNSGDGPAPAATLRYYRSADSTITTGDAEVETDRVRYLDPSETGDESERLTAPSSAGTYYYGACVDWVTDESDTNNNCSSGVQVTVTEALQNSPDLVVSVSIGDTELEPGETFAVTSWVSNSGLATSPATTLRIYRSTDSSISAGDTVIGVGNVRSLAPSETQGYDLRNQIAPSVAGTYYYGSCVESVSGESDTTNNCSSGVRVTVEQTRVKASFQKFYVIDVDLDEYGDHDRECKLQLGGEYRLADWNDLKEYYAAGGSIPELISGLNWKDENTTDVGMKYLKVSKDGNERWGGSRRHYFVSRHDHVRPGYFLVHDHIDNYHLSLGSWYWRGGEALCMPAASAGDAATDRAALVALYNATDGANWLNNGNWLSNAPMGEWHGVTTDSDGRVTHLDLSSNQLTGEIPAELGDLSNLTELYLTNNRLTREIPAEVGDLSNLTHLSLHNNQLTGAIPAELGDLSNLTELYLTNNRLTREIPAEVGDLSNLTHLSLHNNQLTGEIPAELGGLSNLTVLGLSGNQLTGEIPAELGSLSNLTVLGLSGNQLTGEIPAELGSLPNLQFLRLQGNRLTGCIPAGLRNVPDNDLDELGLDDCEARVPFARNPAEDFNGLSAAKNNHPVGIWSDGTTMWVADTADDKIYAYNLGTKARDAGKDFNTLAGAGNNNPEGIWSDGTTMWVVDQQDDKIYAYDMAAKARDTGKDFSTLPDADGFPDNIWSDRTTMWLADPLGPAKLYAYNLGTKARDAGKDFNTLIDAGNSRPEGIWSDGTTMWVADQQDDKIYAYDMATKARDTGKDFNTLAGAGNNLPAGLWSDEATIWVADYVDGKIYAYNMPAASAGDAATDRAALVALYNATGGANWGNNRNWLSNAPMGEWHGVITDSDGLVTHLDLRSNQLTGEIPAELGDLTNLTELQLRSNQLTGAIPAELGNLTNLEGLDLYGNQLTGAIPAELGNLTNLTHLYLSGNQLTGAIPAELGNLANLQTLHLYSNQLTGEIPAELGSLPSLQSLWLQGNQLTGEIPAELGSLPSLEVLDLRTNQLTGEIPAELGDLTNLEELWLSFNQLTGAIPAELGYLTNVEVLRLASNQLTGAIPAELGNLTNLELLSLNSNQLTGAIPAELGNLTNLKGLSLYSNQLTGEIPAELADLSNLEYLYLFNNQLTGEISAELGNLTNLKYLYLYDNQLTGAIPAELGNLTNLTHLWLSSNQLTGEIPAELGNLTSLLSLELYLNQLTGEIPAELGTLTSLRWLWLDRNQLTGEIPAELGNLTNLIRLHLSSNQLTGEIPAELGDLTNLKGLRLYDNQLTGEIPAELGDLTNLTELQLRSNQLTGCIPEGLRNIRRNDFGQLGLPFCGS